MEALNTLDKSEHIKTLIGCFAIFGRVKKLEDEKAYRGENEITDVFLYTAGCETVKEISTMAYPKEFELTHEEIVRIIKKKKKKKRKEKRE